MSKIVLIKDQDKRFQYVSQYFVKLGIDLVIVETELELFYSLETADALVLPVRGVSEDLNINGSGIFLKENYLKKFKGKRIFTGLVHPKLKEICQSNKVQLSSYLDEDIAIKNNYITTEGIIEHISKVSELAIFDSNVLVIGYGKLGKISATVLRTMKANVTVCARHQKDLLHAKLDEFDSFDYNQLIYQITNFDFIITTVPAHVIDQILLEKLAYQDTLIIDVASKPFGLDHEKAKSLHVNSVILPGLPGKIAPRTSGILIAKKIVVDFLGVKT